MIDHVGLNVSDLARSRAFYSEALEPLGYGIFMEWEQHLGFAPAGGSPDFWVYERGDPCTAVHVCFRSPDRATVDAFHAAALAAGGSDNGAPGLRPYHDQYYGAFVLDPDGNNVEAVCHLPEPA